MAVRMPFFYYSSSRFPFFKVCFYEKRFSPFTTTMIQERYSLNRMRRLRQAAGQGGANSLRYSAPGGVVDVADDIVDVSRYNVPQTPFYDLPRHRFSGKPFCLGLARVLPHSMPESQGALATTPRHRLRSGCLGLARDLAHGAEDAAKAYYKRVEAYGTPRTGRDASKVAPTAASPAPIASVAARKESLLLDSANAKQNDGEYDYLELLAEAARCVSKKDWAKADRAYRELIALRPDEAPLHFNLAAVLSNSGHKVEAVQRFLEAKERAPVNSEYWAVATASAFEMLRQCQTENSVVAKPDWWNDEGLKALSAMVARAAPSNETTNIMRADVLSLRGCSAWHVGPRSAAEIMEAAMYYERAATMSAAAPAIDLRTVAGQCRSQAVAMVDAKL